MSYINVCVCCVREPLHWQPQACLAVLVNSRSWRLLTHMWRVLAMCVLCVYARARTTTTISALLLLLLPPPYMRTISAVKINSSSIASCHPANVFCIADAILNGAERSLSSSSTPSRFVHIDRSHILPCAGRKCQSIRLFLTSKFLIANELFVCVCLAIRHSTPESRLEIEPQIISLSFSLIFVMIFVDTVIVVGCTLNVRRRIIFHIM